MTNIQFSTGTYKEYQINGKGTIKVNISDTNIVDRLINFDKEVEKIEKKYGDDITVENAGAIDREIREKVDHIIDCPGACDVAFGNISSVSTVDGVPLYVGFLNALVEQLKIDIKAHNDAEKIKLDEQAKTERILNYITQSKPQPAQQSSAFQAINVAALSQEERERLLNELMRTEQ